MILLLNLIVMILDPLFFRPIPGLILIRIRGLCLGMMGLGMGLVMVLQGRIGFVLWVFVRVDVILCGLGRLAAFFISKFCLNLISRT